MNVNTPAMHELYHLLSTANKKQRYEKASRHLLDAIHLRPVRHDIDGKVYFFLADFSVHRSNKLLQFCYFLQINSNWQNFLFILGWIYMLLAVWEPAHSRQDYYYEEHPEYKKATVIIEALIILVYLFELFIEIYHRRFDTSRSFKEKYITNRKMLCKIVIDTFFALEFVIFYSISEVSFRPSRLFRPCKEANYCPLFLVILVLYQKQLRRTVKGILQSMKQMFDLLLFFLILIVIYAFIGVLLIGDLDGHEPYDKVMDRYFRDNF